MVIVIDELDRCRPTFAIDVLEVVKHMFSTDGIVFVLASNQTQLSHSIASVYGDRFDSLGYLKKFFGVTFRLPPVDKERFLFSELSEECIQLCKTNGGFRSAIGLMFRVYALQDFNLRTAAHYIRRLNYVLASTKHDENYSFVLSLVVALILRSINFDSYLRFDEGTISEVKVIGSILEFENLRKIWRAETRAWIEAV